MKLTYCSKYIFYTLITWISSILINWFKYFSENFVSTGVGRSSNCHILVLLQFALWLHAIFNLLDGKYLDKIFWSLENLRTSKDFGMTKPTVTFSLFYYKQIHNIGLLLIAETILLITVELLNLEGNYICIKTNT